MIEDSGRNGLRESIFLLHGYGLRIAVERGHLVVEDGIGARRRRKRFSRLDRGLKRLVVIGHAGSITLDAIKWLYDVGVPLIHLDNDGTLFLVAAPSATRYVALCRSQALASENGFGLRFSRELVAAKMRGHQRLLEDEFQESDGARKELAYRLRELELVRSPAELRRTEGLGAQAYWSAWHTLPIRFQTRELRRTPEHWRRFGSRTSPLPSDRSPRRAVNPGNAILNYLYALLEAEARIAALAVGLDPMLGILHADHAHRDSLALDLMEPVRPAVDRFALELLDGHQFTRKELFETADGQCRLMPPLATSLAATVPIWARAILPVARRLAQELTRIGPRQRLERTPRRAQQRVMREFTPRLSPGRDPRYQPDAVRRRQASVEEVRRRDREWERRGGTTMTRDEYLREVAPRLKDVSLARIVEMTGLSKASCSRTRRGLAVPHPRHWEALRQLIRSSWSGAR